MVNKVLLVGRMATDSELKYSPSGVAIANFRIACDRNKREDGTKETDFIDCTAWRKQAEFINQYLTKGRLIFVEGRLTVSQWQTPEGQSRRAMSVTVDQVKGLDRPRQEGDAQHQEDRQPSGPAGVADGFTPDPDISDPFA